MLAMCLNAKHACLCLNAKHACYVSQCKHACYVSQCQACLLCVSMPSMLAMCLNAKHACYVSQCQACLLCVSMSNSYISKEDVCKRPREKKTLFGKAISIQQGYIPGMKRKKGRKNGRIVFCLAVIMKYDGRPFDIWQCTRKASVFFTPMCPLTF
ncbi:hypothetical protein CEXT_204861 [Caerostris extrusa]|uniref:Uncharacterized protein n=1 Tax=Caerostris extrusa TaxID=172846 RepID=A0AAV4X883_CAEEX|nr:hypothetical protein CEXT_204861 [Caerostris extrusa]